ncbi:MAG: hypothetical protein QGG48_07530, partial [Desulfatiglandales bacterium]|nr:hypothetical protein [Desulfatiglandales bacterium]
PHSPFFFFFSFFSGGVFFWGGGGGGGGAAPLYDLTGNYNMSIITSFLFTVAGLAPILALPRHFSGVILAKSEVIKKKGRLR